MMMPMPLARTYSDEEEDDGTLQETGTDPQFPANHQEVYGYGYGAVERQPATGLVGTGPGLQSTELRNQHETNGNGSTPRTSGANVTTVSRFDGLLRIFRQIRCFLELASIEPLLFMFRFAMSICDVTIQSFYVDTICQHEFSKDGVDCKNVTDTIRDEIEKISAQYFLYRQLLEYGPPIVFVLFMGQFVDKNGSKFPMLFVMASSAFSSVIYAFLACVPNLTPALILLASAPLAVGGTFVVFLFSAMKHIASNSSMKNRSFRITIAEIIWLLGAPVGLLAALPILKYSGYMPVFILAAVMYVICFVYTVILVRNDIPSASESLGTLLQSDSRPSNYKCSRRTLSSFVEPLQTCCRKRQGPRRLWLLSLLVILFCRFMSTFGDIDMAYLYTHHKFNWRQPEYSTYMTVSSVFKILGSLLLTIVSLKIIPLPDTTIGLISSTFSLVGLILVASSQYSFMMYLGGAFNMFGILIITIVRSLTSKIVAKQEVGKIFSIIACFESVTPLLASVVFNSLFIATLYTFVGAVYVLCASFTLVVVILYGYLAFSMRGQQLHQELEGHPPGVAT